MLLVHLPYSVFTSHTACWEIPTASRDHAFERHLPPAASSTTVQLYTSYFEDILKLQYTVCRYQFVYCLVHCCLVIMAASKPVVLVLGHSYVKRLQLFCDRFAENTSPDFGLSAACTVVFNGRGGRRVEHLWHEIHEIINLSPDHIIVDIGTNDLASGLVPPGQVADAVFAFGRHLVLSCNVRSVHIAPIFRRLPNARNTCPHFNDNVHRQSKHYAGKVRNACCVFQSNVCPRNGRPIWTDPMEFISTKHRPRAVRFLAHSSTTKR
jgi:hypothetical protein